MGAGGDGDKEIIMTCKFLSWAHCLMVSFTQRISTRMGLGFGLFWEGCAGNEGRRRGEIQTHF